MKKLNSDFKFAVLGDSRGKTDQINKDVLGNLLYHIRCLHNPKFILFGGDMILGRFTPNVDANSQFIFLNLMEWQSFVKKALGVTSLKNYVFPVIGNHDYSNENNFKNTIEAFNKAFPYLPSGANGKEMLEDYGKTVYYFDYDNCRFIMLNAVFENIYNGSTLTGQKLVGINNKQMAWLEEVLKNSRKPLNFVMLHCPIIGTYNDYYSLPLDQQEALFKLFNKYHVTSVYVGHEHSYYRRLITNVFFPSDYELSKEIIQITSGCGGAPFRTPGDNKLNIVNSPLCVYEYGIVEVCGTKVINKFYDINGILIDIFAYDTRHTWN